MACGQPLPDRNALLRLELPAIQAGETPRWATVTPVFCHHISGTKTCLALGVTHFQNHTRTARKDSVEMFFNIRGSAQVRVCHLHGSLGLLLFIFTIFLYLFGFPGGSDGKASACTVGNLGLIPVSGRSPGEGNDNPLQYSCLENPRDRRAC